MQPVATYQGKNAFRYVRFVMVKRFFNFVTLLVWHLDIMHVGPLFKFCPKFSLLLALWASELWIISGTEQFLQQEVLRWIYGTITGTSAPIAIFSLFDILVFITCSTTSMLSEILGA